MNECKPVIKVIGVGGGGCNAISFMSCKDIESVKFIAANTDAQDLEKLDAVEDKIQLGKELTKGLGAGANPEIGRESAELDKELICSFLENTNMLFISAGMGGGTGTGAAPVIAKYAREMGILVVAVVTKPFAFEREQRMKKAESGIEELKKHVDSLIVIPNENLRDSIKGNTPLAEVFETVDNVLFNAIEGISDVITKPGIINIDFNDVKTIMNNSGNAMIGIGVGSGENKAREAAEAAINCPLLEEKNLSCAKRVIVNVTLDLSGNLDDFEAVGDIVKQITAEDAEVITGTSYESLDDQIKVTIIATDFVDSSKVVEDVVVEEPVDNSLNNDLPSLLMPKSKNKNENLLEIESTKEDLDHKENDQPIQEEEKVEEISLPMFLRKKI